MQWCQACICSPCPVLPCHRWFEQDPEEIYQSVLSCVEKVGGALQSHDLSRLKGVGLTNQRETTIMWDRKTGRCLHNALVWCDGRTADLVTQVIGTRSKDRLRVCQCHSPLGVM